MNKIKFKILIIFGGGSLKDLVFDKKKINDKIIWELSRMEQYAEPDYFIIMKRFSKFLRMEVWNHITAIYLYSVLVVINTCFDLFYKDISFPNYEIIIQYIEQFEKVWTRFCPSNLTTNRWNNLKWDIDKLLTDIIIEKQWDRINPYTKKNNKEHFDKDLRTIFDDMFKNSIIPNEYAFIRDYKSIKHMYRGTRGIHDYTWLLPNPKFNKSDNRWNPKERCFVYAALEDTESIFDAESDIFHGDMVCLEELRARKGEKITLGELKFLPNIENKKIFDFSYNDISFFSIKSQIQNEQQLLTIEIINKVKKLIDDGQIGNFEDIQQEVKSKIGKKQEDIVSMTAIYIGKTFLKMICDKIYIPLDSDEDINPKKKSICYGAFHVMADYFEKRGYAGIIYPSTRAALIKQSGKNIVIFNYKDVTYKEGSLKVIEYN